MKTEKKTVQDLITERGGLINKREGLSVKMNEIIDKASAEKRDFTPEEEAKLKESYAHLCKLRDEVIGMGVLPAIKDWKSINPNID